VVICAKTAQPIMMLFLDCGLGLAQGIMSCIDSPPIAKAQFFGESGAHRKEQGHSAVNCAKMAEPFDMPFGMWAEIGPRNHKLDGNPDPPHRKAQFWSKAVPIVKYRDILL